MKKIIELVTAAALFVFTASAYAIPVGPGSYQLFDHPSGNLTASHGPYGLRMDDLTANVSGPVFSVSSSGASVFLDWDGGSSATIAGDIYNNQTGKLWQVHHVINNIIAVADGFYSTDEVTSILTLTDDNSNVFTYTGKSDGNSAFSFLGDSHRCALYPDCGPIVGRGWFQDATGRTDGTNDWLVQARKVPAPAPAVALLLAAGLIGIGAMRRLRA